MFAITTWLGLIETNSIVVGILWLNVAISGIISLR